MIRLEKITKYYPTTSGLHYVLRDASVEIPARAQIGVLGRNGSGKSTLMRMLAGVDVPNEGRITKWGSVSWPLGIASGVQATMTGRENTRFACRIQGMAYHEMEPIVDFVQSFAELGHFFDMPARVYSSGMRARLGFGITMAFDFDFYIIDELSAVGDATFRNKAAHIFREKRVKSGFVRASHSLSELRAECTSGLVLHNAGLEYWPTIDEAIERYLSVNGLASESVAKSKKKTAEIAAVGQKSRRGASRPADGVPAETRSQRAAKRKARLGNPARSKGHVRG